MPQVIGAELEFKTVSCLPRGRQHDPGIIDQQIQSRVTVKEGVCKSTHASQVGQIERIIV